ncbi:MAG: chemotaxis protein CheA, partial [Terracidiphilus sp.]
ALDQIGAMLEEEAGGAEPADPAICKRILESVRRLAGIEEAAAPVKQPEPTPNGCSVDAGPMRSWRIRFVPGPDLMSFGASPFLLLRELRQLGELSIHPSMAAIPPLAELDAERCYVSWEMVLATAVGREVIRDVFIFVEDSCELSIEADREAASDGTGDAEGMTPVSEADVTAMALAEKRTQAAGRRIYDKPDNASSLRVPAAKLDQFVNLVGELVTVQAQLSEIAAQRDDAGVAQVAEEIERLTSALRESSMSIRMMPIRGTFERFRRLVHDLARDLGKEVELTIEGADTELDKSVIDQLGDPLMHLIRNSMDHGVEAPRTREAQGKPAMAAIHLSARHSGASVLISVADDGAGIDAEAVRGRAVEKKLVAPDASLTEREIFALIFQPGFSTAKTVTDVSGRGVGMDVVRQRVDSLRGTIEVASNPGLGTSVTLRLPLTMAIIDGLLVGVGDAHFVLPLASTLECIELTREDLERANGKHVANVRGEIVPYIRLRERFNMRGERPAIEQIMVVETTEGRCGFVVDHVLGNCQTVIKSLGRFYRSVEMVSGATILGNGTVALILDPDRLIRDALQAELRGGGRGRSAIGGGRPRDGIHLTA